MPDLIYNNDSDNIFSYHRHDMSPQVVDERVDIVAESGANIFIQDVCAQRTNFDSSVWESWLTGFDPDAGPDQPLFDGLDPEEQQGCYEQHTAMLTIRELGIDYTGRTLERCRDKGMSPWISIRLNDHHGTAPEPLAKTVSQFWLDHPEYRLHTDRKASRGFQTLDYAEPAVHERYRQLITEVLQRYDIEGLELDAMRSPFVFRIGREYENRHIMTQWMAEVRGMLDAAAEKRGHPIDLAVRLASRPDTARRFGFDVAEWARQGSVNMVVLAAGPFGGEIDNDAPIALWKDLLSPYGVKVAGTLLPGEARYPGAPGEGINGNTTAAPDGAIGCALAMIHAGADGIELFNYFPEKVLDNGRGWTLDSFKSTLKAMRSVDTMLPLRRKHFVSGRQCTAHGELICHNPLLNVTSNACYEMGTGQYPLPAQGHWLAFRLQTGPKPTGRDVHVILGTEAGQPDGHTLNAPPKVLVNDVECSHAPYHDNEHWHRYDVPPQAFADGEHVIEVIAQGAGDSPQIRISRIEFIVEER